MPLFIGANYTGILSKSIKWNYLPRRKKLFTQSCCNISQKSLKETTPVSFAEMLKLRQLEARSSILVQVQSAKSFNELYSYCNSFGTVQKMFHYSMGIDPMHFIIVQFNSKEEVLNALKHSAFMEEQQVVPVQSTFLWFSAANKKSPKLKQNSKTAELSVENGTKPISEAHTSELLKNAKNISDQMRILYNRTRLNDTGVRLRFLMAQQIESAISGLFPHATVYPFGSSVNGYGKMNCDLDVVLRLNQHQPKMDDSRLIFHCKAANSTERSTSQRHMESIGDIIQLFLPGCTQVRRILQARIPIIKYYQQLTDVECDLSMANMSGVYMSDFLYMMGSFDERVGPLVFTVRKWAQSVGLTSSSPGRWITNFSLTLLVLAFLQRPLVSPPVLPTLNHLVKLAGPTDQHITDDGINGTFLRDITRITLPTLNTDSPESLLRQFFTHYAQFDFGSKAINLNDATPTTKPDHSAIYIINPLERGLNVSKNVSAEELDKFRSEVRSAAWTLDTDDAKQKEWGVLALFDAQVRSAAGKSGKLIQVSELFDGCDRKSEVKCDDVMKTVQQIKKETKINIRRMNNNLKNRHVFKR